MKVLPFNRFIDIAPGTPYIPLDSMHHGLCVFEKAITDRQDFFFRNFDGLDGEIESFLGSSISQTAGGCFVGVIPDSFDTVGERDGEFDDGRSFVVLESLNSRLSYMENVAELLQLHKLSVADKKKCVDALSEFLATGVKSKDERQGIDLLGGDDQEPLTEFDY
jgi:hypothetical protein